MAAISHVFTIRRAAQILGRDEDLLWELSDQLEPEDGKLWVCDIDGAETPRLHPRWHRGSSRNYQGSDRSRRLISRRVYRGAQRMLTVLTPFFQELWAAAIGDSPHRAVSVLADEESAVMRHRHADGAGPNGGVVHDETGHEVLIFAGRHPVLQARADHLVAGPFSSVPRAVLVRNRIPAIFRGELVAIVDDHSHRGRMRLDQHVGNGDLVL